MVELDKETLWPVKDSRGFKVGFFHKEDFIRISKYYNTETVMRKELNRIRRLPKDERKALMQKHIISS